MGIAVFGQNEVWVETTVLLLEETGGEDGMDRRERGETVILLGV